MTMIIDDDDDDDDDDKSKYVYKDLELKLQLQRMWHMKTILFPVVVVGACCKFDVFSGRYSL